MVWLCEKERERERLWRQKDLIWVSDRKRERKGEKVSERKRETNKTKRGDGSEWKSQRERARLRCEQSLCEKERDWETNGVREGDRN